MDKTRHIALPIEHVDPRKKKHSGGADERHDLSVRGCKRAEINILRTVVIRSVQNVDTRSFSLVIRKADFLPPEILLPHPMITES